MLRPWGTSLASGTVSVASLAQRASQVSLYGLVAAPGRP